MFCDNGGEVESTSVAGGGGTSEKVDEGVYQREWDCSQGVSKYSREREHKVLDIHRAERLTVRTRAWLGRDVVGV